MSESCSVDQFLALVCADSDSLFSAEELKVEAKKKKDRIETTAHVRKAKIELRRANSEAELRRLIPEVEQGMSYHVISGGDVDAMSYAKLIVDSRPLDYLLFSTWCMAMVDVEQIERWLDSGRIGRIDAYMGEIFQNQYPDCYQKLKTVLKAHGCRMVVFRNHSKIFAGTGDGFAFAIESSANINTNPRTEQTAIHADQGLFDHYKAFFDGIKSFNREFDEVIPWALNDKTLEATGEEFPSESLAG